MCGTAPQIWNDTFKTHFVLFVLLFTLFVVVGIIRAEEWTWMAENREWNKKKREQRIMVVGLCFTFQALEIGLNAIFMYEWSQPQMMTTLAHSFHIVWLCVFKQLRR